MAGIREEVMCLGVVVMGEGVGKEEMGKEWTKVMMSTISVRVARVTRTRKKVVGEEVVGEVLLEVVGEEEAGGTDGVRVQVIPYSFISDSTLVYFGSTLVQP